MLQFLSVKEHVIVVIIVKDKLRCLAVDSARVPSTDLVSNHLVFLREDRESVLALVAVHSVYVLQKSLDIKYVMVQ